MGGHAGSTPRGGGTRTRVREEGLTSGSTQGAELESLLDWTWDARGRWGWGGGCEGQRHCLGPNN